MKSKTLSFIPLLLLALFYALFLHIGSWLAAADSPQRADVIVCISGSSARTDKAVSLLQQGLAGNIAVTTDQVYRAVLAKKVPPENILRADWSATTTFQEGMIIKSLLDHRYASAMVVSDTFHLFLVRWSLQHFFPDGLVRFSFISSDAPPLQGFWWSKPGSRLFVLSELPKILYYWTWHGLLGIAEDPQWAIDLERDYLAFVREVFIRRMV